MGVRGVRQSRTSHKRRTWDHSQSCRRETQVVHMDDRGAQCHIQERKLSRSWNHAQSEWVMGGQGAGGVPGHLKIGPWLTDQECPH